MKKDISKRDIAKKVILFSIIAIFVFFLVNSFVPSFADELDPGSFDPHTAVGSNPGEVDENVATYIGPFFNILYVVSIVLAVISMSIIGLLMIVGSPAGKAQYKEHLIPVVEGIAIISFLTTILGTIIKFAESI